MSYYPRPARAAAFDRCHETCQKVRAEIHEAIEHELNTLGIDLPARAAADLTDAAFSASLEFGTDKVRAALIECEMELIEERKVKEGLEDELRDVKSEVESLRDEVESLQSQLDSTPSA